MCYESEKFLLLPVSLDNDATSQGFEKCFLNSRANLSRFYLFLFTEVSHAKNTSFEPDRIKNIVYKPLLPAF